MPKLSNVRAFAIETAPPHKGGLRWYFLKLETEDGLEGWGETAVLASFYGLEKGYEALVQDIFNTHLKGEEALDRERLYHNLYRKLTQLHPDYFTFGLISAFDTALWDICGKYFNTPVYNLLGGTCRDRIRTYTYIYDDSDQTSLRATAVAWTANPERLGELAAEYVEQGFTGLKFDPLIQNKEKLDIQMPWDLPQSELGMAERTVAAVREAIGDKADILIGTHGQITPSAAIRFAKRIEAYDPLWLEEPCPPENCEEMARVAAATSIPVSTGERLVTPHEFQRLFAAGACAIAQPDMGSAGGITAVKKIAALAETYYVLMAPHVWGGPIITAAALQIDACIPNFLIQESIGKSDGFFNEILKEPLVWEEGDLLVPTSPGIGAELNESVLEQYRVNK
ncbi:MAG: mandelate racemase/muconate lactonizing enzyme family protein [Gammaproteobacteria bacterium]|nr:mandelate racemase/muconate lactonizing enzyme family protein [Gammaproteobacteria bacterium]MDD9894225.1 mandelate racemase/muconate lactonizing enzyme family protein [Gammaproteobacteria bacterium]MDD9957426.1 mandelate racemase/muconate lactonizing enzyme family protein [Gammaproteobacteria bacterium]